jgi:hypothetical protein
MPKSSQWQSQFAIYSWPLLAFKIITYTLHTLDLYQELKQGMRDKNYWGVLNELPNAHYAQKKNIKSLTAKKYK